MATGSRATAQTSCADLKPTHGVIRRVPLSRRFVPLARPGGTNRRITSTDHRCNARSAASSAIRIATFVTLALAAGCRSGSPGGSAAPVASAAPIVAPTPPASDGAHVHGSLPLERVGDVVLPGAPNRFDYQDLDAKTGRLVVAHMNAGSVLIIDLATARVLKELTGIPTARGVAVAPELGRAFVTASPNHVVIIDELAMTELARVTTGSAPDGIAWDPAHHKVGVSAQGDGALTILADEGRGARVDVPLGRETGNVIYDSARSVFWIAVVTASGRGELVSVDPVTAKKTREIPLPGCDGAHGVRLAPRGESAFVACEGNDTLARVPLDGSVGAAPLVLAGTGAGPDVMAIDPGIGWLYVAAESGDLAIFDIDKPGLTLVGHEHPGAAAHSVAVDPATHRAFFPLAVGANGRPVLRIMRPTL